RGTRPARLSAALADGPRRGAPLQASRRRELERVRGGRASPGADSQLSSWISSLSCRRPGCPRPPVLQLLPVALTRCHGSCYGSPRSGVLSTRRLKEEIPMTVTSALAERTPAIVD